jgi:glutaredoxin
MVEITVLYGTSWCPDVRRSRKFLDNKNIAYNYIDVDLDEQAAQIVRDMNNGRRKVPTIVFSDNSILVEPSNEELAAKLGI